MARHLRHLGRHRRGGSLVVVVLFRQQQRAPDGNASRVRGGIGEGDSDGEAMRKSAHTTGQGVDSKLRHLPQPVVRRVRTEDTLLHSVQDRVREQAHGDGQVL